MEHVISKLICEVSTVGALCLKLQESHKSPNMICPPVGQRRAKPNEVQNLWYLKQSIIFTALIG